MSREAITERNAEVVALRCFGCNRIKMPTPWTPAWIPLLRAERRLHWREYLCDHDDCQANDIAKGISR